MHNYHGVNSNEVFNGLGYFRFLEPLIISNDNFDDHLNKCKTYLKSYKEPN